jgi:peptide/nickel transport system substrate-binding protein
MALAGILFSYLALTYTTTQVPTTGGTYIEGVAGTPRHINPLLSAYNEADEDLCALVFSGLTRFNDRGEIAPDLAESWEASLDGLTYVFHLRSDVHWHDGSPFTADDVLFTVGLLRDPDYPGPPDIGSLWQTVRVEKEDNYTVRFVLSEPFAPFLDYTTIGLLPAHLLEGIRAAELPELDFNLSPVGTGPFQLAEIDVVEGEISSILFQRNPRYYGGGPLLEHVRIRFYPSYPAVFHAYETREVDGVSRVSRESLPRAREEENLELYSAQIARYAIIFFNLSQKEELPFFQDAEVRQALLYGLDREAIVEQTLSGQAIVARSPIVAGTWAYYDDLQKYDFDPDRARALLDESGWTLPPGAFARNREGESLAFTLLASTDPIQTAVAEEVARQWEELGVRATVATTSTLDLREALERRDYQAALVELALPGDPDPYPLWHQTQITVGQNYAGLDHRRISEVIETARTIVSRDQREELYSEFQELFAQEVPAILLYHPVYTYGVDRKVQGVQVGPLMRPSDRFAAIEDFYMATRRVIVSQTEAQ